jgi:hypothetical protein
MSGSAMPATGMRGDAIAVLRETQHVAVPRISVFRGQPCENVTTGPWPQSL